MKYSRLEKRLAAMEPEPQPERKASIPSEAFAESVGLIDQTIPPDLKDNQNPAIEWVGAMLKGDTKTVKVIEKLPEVARFEI